MASKENPYIPKTTTENLNSLLKSQPELKKSLSNIIFARPPRKEENTLETLLSDKGKTLKATVKALLAEIKLRENLDESLIPPARIICLPPALVQTIKIDEDNIQLRVNKGKLKTYVEELTRAIRTGNSYKFRIFLIINDTLYGGWVEQILKLPYGDLEKIMLAIKGTISHLSQI